jgi:hypothetical protein
MHFQRLAGFLQTYSTILNAEVILYFGHDVKNTDLYEMIAKIIAYDDPIESLKNPYVTTSRSWLEM